MCFMCRCDLWIWRVASALGFAWAYGAGGACLSENLKFSLTQMYDTRQV